jgi:hypothetical protein
MTFPVVRKRERPYVKTIRTMEILSKKYNFIKYYCYHDSPIKVTLHLSFIVQ